MPARILVKMARNLSDRNERSSDTIESPEPPNPPGSLPQYVVDGVRRQDSETLEDLTDWLADVVEHRRAREVVAEDVVGEGEDLVDAVPEEKVDADVGDGGGRGTVVLKEIPCGKEGCGGCPHGPYAYRAYWRDGATRTEYLGRADEVLER